MDKLVFSGGVRRRILIVDDEFINRELLGNILARKYDVVYASNGQEARDLMAVEDNDFSLILLDLIMPVMNGFEFLEKMKENENLRRVPVIVMTSEKDAEVKSIRLGAADFITKPYDMPEVILARCERIIRLYEDRILINSAEKDEVTGLYTRSFYFEYIRQIEHRRRIASDVLVFNIDHFHLVNEMYGRQAGDEVLRCVAGIISDVMKNNLIIACRTDADTFYAYCSHIEDYGSLMADIRERIGDAALPARIRLRAGIYLDAEHDTDIESRFDRARGACNRIKDDFTTDIEYFDRDLYQRFIYQERLIKDIYGALARGEVKVYYQPKYDITGDRPKLRSAEALVRWEHKELGMISPGDFIPLFERNGLIQMVDNYVWRKAAEQMRRWEDEYGYSPAVSVNVSRIDVFDPYLEEKLRKITEENGLSEGKLMLEITESAYTDDADSLTSVTKRLREIGFKIEMDDFGTGYSSLNMVTTIPFDVMKLDMKFVRNMTVDDKSRRMVELIIDIARFMEVIVVAEGVETEEQLNMLKEMGCQVIQGYYFSRPLPAEEFGRLIEKEMGSGGIC